MKSLFLCISLLISASSFAETQSELIERTSGIISFDQRILIPILNVYRKIEALDIEGFEYGYACQDIGKAQLAIDLALHRKMEVEYSLLGTRYAREGDEIEPETIDLNKLSVDLNKIQDQICQRHI